MCNNGDIANCFSDNFKAIYQPNSVLGNEKLKARFLSKFNAYENKHFRGEYFSIEKIAEQVKMLKRGKATGVDTLTAEHSMFASPVYITCNSCCLNLCLNINVYLMILSKS